MLRDWYLIATQALIDSIGSINALDLLEPHYRNAGAAGAKYLQDFTGIRSKDIPTLTILEGAGNSWALRGEARVMASDDVGTLEIFECKTEGKSKEVCILICKVCCGSICKYLDPSYSFFKNKTLSEGDDSCKWTYMKSGGSGSLISDDMKELSLPPITKGDLDDYSHQTLGEMWNISTTVLVERLGPNKAMEVLRGRIARLVKERAELIGQKAKITGKGVEDVRKVRDLLSSNFNKKVKINLTDEGIEGEVKECPFSNSPYTICLQYHLFLNETLNALGLPFEMICESFMSKGDATCLWKIIKKGKSEKGRMGEEDEALKILRVRLAKGEITPDQYRQLKDILTSL